MNPTLDLRDLCALVIAYMEYKVTYKIQFILCLFLKLELGR